MSTIEISTTSPAFPAPARPGRDALPRRLAEVVRRALPEQVEAAALVRDFLLRRCQVPRLVEIARSAGPWPIRLLAGRMLECRILAGDESVFDHLGISGDAKAQVRARLSRFEFLHRAIDGVHTSPAALDRFLRLSRQPCLVPLARHLFSDDEVLDRVYDLTRQSRGVYDADCDEPRAAQRALAEIPPRDARLAAALAATHEIFWVDQRTPSEINSLIEYPLGTVALVIKPPGSDVEIEIKRAGIRGPRAWDVVYSRNGYVVCSTHHLQGAAVGQLLGWQISAEARFAAIWRAVYGEVAPISRTLRVNSVFKMPLDGGGFANVIRFFSDRDLYGDGYDAMREELAQALQSLLRFEGEPPYEAPNDLALTAKFFGSIKPGQAVQVGTSSFRVDRVAQYLRPEGAAGYFAALGIPFDQRGALAFADQLLHEILVDYVPPRTRTRTYRSYLRAAFAIPANRARADRNYLDCARQIGKMFGTCAAICSGSNGESFVARNVGLRSVFEDGAWRLKVIFIDHDALYIAERGEQEVLPAHVTPRIRDDYAHIAGSRSDPTRLRGTLRLLADIYRVSPMVRREGVDAFQASAAAAFRATRSALRGTLSPFFHPRWIERLEDFDQAVKTLLRAGRPTRAWRESMAPLLSSRRQTTLALIDQYVRGIGHFARLWRRLAYMYDSREVQDAASATAAG